ncbi:protein-tyrosine-phosphatase [Sporocytophaga myxococcoides]|uniref:Protein-tyrosine-phosphatase n=1 Tax=Sporocytophaga myxococcoides TaxID=153721 RepID=A0A098LGM2_9BACT|nr:protein-tyrosine-phosphatase [Sporocytophaga myxococcoides]GAL86115.1 protein-tyrosine-phosphatase [Sporocytophaga myxococcoides]
MLSKIKNYIEDAIKTFDTIPEERKRTLEKIALFIQRKQDEGKTTELIYVCTHNSRRSHLGQIWGKTAAAYYGIKNINTYSAGTETTAFNPNAIKAVQNAGFEISKEEKLQNPLYSVYYSENQAPVSCFSKTYEDSSIPKKDLCAIMTCTEADGNCPFIPGTELRISCPYNDPKAFDGTPQQDEKYAERCKQVATECLYVFSKVKPF